LQNNLIYPQKAREGGIQGMVYFSFIVEKNGSISHVKLHRSFGGGCDEESI